MFFVNNIFNMSIIKEVKDKLIKVLYGKGSVPRGLVELNEYFRLYDDINFEVKEKNGKYIVRSTNYRYGSIMTVCDTKEEIEKNIQDAILTSFSVPSSYAAEAKLKRVGVNKQTYAFA